MKFADILNKPDHNEIEAIMIRSILVPLDGSQFGEHALPAATTIANRTDARLQLTYVHPPLANVAPYVSDEALIDHIKSYYRAYLDDVVNCIKASTSIEVSCELMEGPVAPTIKELAESGGFELVVMTTHGRGPFARFWLGSVADELLRDLSIPLLLIQPTEAKPDITQTVEWNKLLVPLDGTSFSEGVLDHASNLCKAMNMDIRLLRVVEPAMLKYYGPGVSVAGPAAEEMMSDLQKVESQTIMDAEQYLERLAEGLRANAFNVETHVAVEDQPAGAILERMESMNVDVLALESHGRHGLSRFFLGSVADKIIRGATIPVLVHRH